MKNREIKFSCSSLSGTNKAGLIKKDADGYYPMVVGALNVFNSAGEYYVYEEAKELFLSSSQLQRRVSRGALRGEYGHPKMLPGMNGAQFMNRVMSIYEENVCCHHKEISLDFDNVKDDNGKPVIAIVSKVLPSGPKGSILQSSIDNPNENVCFSIRAYTDDYVQNGITKRILKNVVTFDYVNEPGISVAVKFKSPSLETLLEKQISREMITMAAKVGNGMGLVMESKALSVAELFQSLGWESPSSEKAVFSQW